LNQVDPRNILASNRAIPIAPAPQYSEGFLEGTSSSANMIFSGPVPYPGDGGGFYARQGPGNASPANPLMVWECVFDKKQLPLHNLPNPPTSWFWNIRVGDKIQINNSGLWYTVIGPMVIPPQGVVINGQVETNPEMFVNVGLPGTQSPLQWMINGILTHPDFLFLVNGEDDNKNGWVDEGWDGVDNNANGQVDELAEWETEQWQGALGNTVFAGNTPYTIQRRPAPVPNAREIALPSNVVVDLTTWNYPPTSFRPPSSPSLERSRLPVNRFTGYVDIIVNPDGTVVPTTIYSSAASLQMGGAFLHFWLSERSDLAAPDPTKTMPPYLPLPKGLATGYLAGNAEIDGEYRLITLFTRTGGLLVNDNVPFDAANVGTAAYNPSLQFLGAQQGITGGQ
jgi:hypothetical protein